MQNERNDKARHSERNRNSDDVLNNKKTCPEETIIQVGKLGESISSIQLLEIAIEYFAEMEKRFSKHFHVIDWALHNDEGTPHIHERHIIDAPDEYGELFPRQDKALEMMGIELPNPNKKQGKHNNRKITFDEISRSILESICEKHELEINKDHIYGGEKYKEKNDYIVDKQKQIIEENSLLISSQQEQINEESSRLNELKEDISDTEALIERITDDAYSKACEVITASIVEEVKTENINVIKAYEDYLTDPERKIAPEKKDVIKKYFDKLVEKVSKTGSEIFVKLKEKLMGTDISKENKSKIKESVKESFADLLKKAKEEKQIYEEQRRLNKENNLQAEEIKKKEAKRNGR